VAKISLKVYGKHHTLDEESDMPLLYALRNNLQLSGPKCVCGLAQCGACAVFSALSTGQRV
jgi:aerobic-type carbon monoxide dehydrogenase small subunit (CoxS/CutS family)